MNSKKMLFFGEYFSRYIKTVLEFVMERWIVLSDFISRDFEKEWSMFNMSIVCASQISVDKVHVRYISIFFHTITQYTECLVTYVQKLGTWFFKYMILFFKVRFNDRKKVEFSILFFIDNWKSTKILLDTNKSLTRMNERMTYQWSSNSPTYFLYKL